MTDKPVPAPSSSATGCTCKAGIDKRARYHADYCPMRIPKAADTEHGMSSEELGGKFGAYFKPAAPEAGEVETNAGFSTCPICHTRWLVIPREDCLLPSCGCFGEDASAANPARPCHSCGIHHADSCKKMAGVEVERQELVLRLVGVFLDTIPAMPQVEHVAGKYTWQADQYAALVRLNNAYIGWQAARASK